MARFCVRDLTTLDRGWILAPERYDPRRTTNGVHQASLGSFVRIVSEQVHGKRADSEVAYLILDTGDAQEGVIRIRKAAVTAAGIGSNKKRVRPGDVIISRLRPYLRQVAWLDPLLFDGVSGRVDVLVSTEFFVVRSKDSASIAFLVPFLLSIGVQEILAAAQEGGHHPRFNQQTLEALGIPERVLAEREQISSSIEAIVAQARKSDFALRSIIASIDRLSEARADHLAE
jgi:hypothetical protein